MGQGKEAVGQQIGRRAINRNRIAGELLVLAKSLISEDFPSDEALKRYLREHPDADRSNHRVVKPSRKRVEKKPSGLKVSDHLRAEAKKFDDAEEFADSKKGILDSRTKTFDIRFKDGKSVKLDKTVRTVGRKRLQELGGEVDGDFIGIRFYGDNETLTIIGFASVSKGKGYGTEILNSIIQNAKDSGYTKIVAKDTRTTDSMGYWEKQGFKKEGNIDAVLDIVPTKKQKLMDIWKESNKRK